MKKTLVLSSLVVVALAFSYCSSSRKAATTKHVITYEANVAPIVMANCAPCHFPDKGGKKKALDNYNGVTAQVDEVLRRIQLNPTDRGFMPDRHPKLADSTIAVFKQWKADGLLAR
ncbi:MAG: cytochrome c [Sediminibacterium sp.]|nr:cytochrome c [Sediminibacterium sp.]